MAKQVAVPMQMLNKPEDTRWSIEMQTRAVHLAVADGTTRTPLQTFQYIQSKRLTKYPEDCDFRHSPVIPLVLHMMRGTLTERWFDMGRREEEVATWHTAKSAPRDI